eukprot:1958559-Amphidinium_carterae.1
MTQACAWCLKEATFSCSSGTVVWQPPKEHSMCIQALRPPTRTKPNCQVLHTAGFVNASVSERGDVLINLPEGTKLH